jgi:hypothetical protein
MSFLTDSSFLALISCSRHHRKAMGICSYFPRPNYPISFRPSSLTSGLRFGTANLLTSCTYTLGLRASLAIITGLKIWLWVPWTKSRTWLWCVVPTDDPQSLLIIPQSKPTDVASLSYWLFNTTLLLHLLRCDNDTNQICEILGLFGLIEELLNVIYGQHQARIYNAF